MKLPDFLLDCDKGMVSLLCDSQLFWPVNQDTYCYHH